MKKISPFSLTILLLLCIALLGCNNTQLEDTSTVSPRLQLFTTIDDDISFLQVSPEDLGSTYSIDMQYYGFSEIAIEVDGQKVELLTAIRNNLITPEEIIAFAKIDARNDLCNMEYHSNWGYTHYAFSYENFEIVSVYDVFEAPDGQQYHQERITFATPGFYGNTTFGAPFIEINGNRTYLASENWGLTFEPVYSDSQSLQVSCLQQEGQQIGELQVYHYTIQKVNNTDSLSPLLSKESDNEQKPYATIQSNSTTNFIIDWRERYGTLPPGKYVLSLYIEDVYDSIHPLMKNFQDKQKHSIQFEILE